MDSSKVKKEGNLAIFMDLDDSSENYIFNYKDDLSIISTQKVTLGPVNPPKGIDGSKVHPSIFLYKSKIYMFYPFNFILRYTIDPYTSQINTELKPEKIETKELIDFGILAASKRSIIDSKNKPIDFLFITSNNKLLGGSTWEDTKSIPINVDL